MFDASSALLLEQKRHPFPRKHAWVLVPLSVNVEIAGSPAPPPGGVP